jgi:hypothetical protein
MEFHYCKHGYDINEKPCPQCNGMDEYGPSLKDIESHGAEYWWHQAGFWKRSFMELSKLINAKEKTEAKTQCSPLKGMHEMRKKKSSGG